MPEPSLDHGAGAAIPREFFVLTQVVPNCRIDEALQG